MEPRRSDRDMASKLMGLVIILFPLTGQFEFLAV